MNVGPSQAMPPDGVIQIAFDRYLLPDTVNRQSITLLDASNNPVDQALAPNVTYDPIARTITLSNPNGIGKLWLTDKLTYKVYFGVPNGDDDLGGLRSIDRATLDPATNRLVAFAVDATLTAPAADPTIDFCADVLPIFNAKCSGSTCHASTTGKAAASLVLQTSTGINDTAIRRPAQSANTGARAGSPSAPGRIFGVDMPLVDPGKPENSWLLYKIELAERPTVNAGPAENIVCNGAAGASTGKVVHAPDYVPLVPTFAPSDFEHATLSDYVLGREMPYPSPYVSNYTDQALTFAERERVRLWITQMPSGGLVPECGGCGVVEATDAGADASP